jgi:hypothetical protein
MTLSRSLALGAALVALAVPATAAANTTEQFSSPRGRSVRGRSRRRERRGAAGLTVANGA